MRAVALDYEHRQLTRRELPAPQPAADDQVLFRVQEVGVCGTDRALAGFRLGFPPAGEPFLVLGHEALGQVVEVGPAATTLRPGDWVVPMVRRPCRPPCPACARGRRDLCVSGKSLERGIFGLHGYFTEYALDSAADLVPVPETLFEFAVLIEPLSVAEKAVETALRLHEPEPATALVLGAGPIGLLAALALRQRGLDTAIFSLEPPDHPRARLAGAAGIHYLATAENCRADIVIEATGSPEAAFRGFRCLAPLGVYGILGSPNARGDVPLLDMIANNQTVFGSVNASPQAFCLALKDLGRMDRALLSRMIRRAGFDEYSETIPAPPGDAAKIVHVIR